MDIYVDGITLKPDIVLHGRSVESGTALAEPPGFPKLISEPNETILGCGQGGRVVATYGLGQGLAPHRRIHLTK